MSDQEIIQKLKLENLPQQTQQQMLAQINEIIELRIAGTLDDVMNEAQRATFTQLSRQSPEVVWQWLTREFTNLAELYEATLGDYLDEVTQQVADTTQTS